MPGSRRLCLLVCVLVQLSLCLAARGEMVVKWDALKKLDDLAERCEALADKKDVAQLRKIAGPVKKAGAVVAVAPAPAGAKRPAEVVVLQRDLRNLMDSLTDPRKQDGAELTAILAGLHPIVEKLMEAAGMPHVHEEEGKAGKP